MSTQIPQHELTTFLNELIEKGNNLSLEDDIIHQKFETLKSVTEGAISLTNDTQKYIDLNYFKNILATSNIFERYPEYLVVKTDIEDNITTNDETYIIAVNKGFFFPQRGIIMVLERIPTIISDCISNLLVDLLHTLTNLPLVGHLLKVDSSGRIKFPDMVFFFYDIKKEDIILFIASRIASRIHLYLYGGISSIYKFPRGFEENLTLDTFKFDLVKEKGKDFKISLIILFILFIYYNRFSNINLQQNCSFSSQLYKLYSCRTGKKKAKKIITFLFLLFYMLF